MIILAARMIVKQKKTAAFKVKKAQAGLPISSQAGLLTAYRDP